ncbi:E3 ubiquitin-protein ligase RNF170-like [Selaginella moellendorffii]|uniref:E3 ubiquitin-protein ligase RNF170-like n=1 Tax=Selaginella moellendorffii TaxID=88036 RepID=UPI000D1C5C21|nr:E3 ubiquitin-protein ligase RNF170-like [Selaginella moellendorffii]XP_024537586.1 E3 ubiquitin-protein ligase RNF170-like [Selaginella moellendorffii]|eukprot:XP_024537585.1 E3 ubiquitin-protein ligase RNF170-like [Selaginella moellendorffii]
MSSDRRRSSYIWWYDKSLNFFRDRSAKQELTTRSSKTLTDLDCCSVCQEQFTLPCQANCTHWFCGECILRVWEYGSALLPCKCPICRQPITHLWPSEFSTTEEATNFMPLLTDIATYNLNFDSRVITILRRWLHWVIFQLKFPDTEVRCLHVLHFLFLLVLALYVVCTLNLILEGSVTDGDLYKLVQALQAL